VNNANIDANAGGLGVAGVAAVGASVSTNDIDNATRAYVDGSTVNSSAGTIEVTAASNATISALTIGAAGAITFAAGGSVSLNEISNILDAHITNNAIVNASGQISVLTVDRSTIDANAGGFGIAAVAAVGASIATNDIDNLTWAYIDGSTVTGVFILG